MISLSPSPEVEGAEARAFRDLDLGALIGRQGIGAVDVVALGSGLCARFAGNITERH